MVRRRESERTTNGNLADERHATRYLAAAPKSLIETLSGKGDNATISPIISLVAY